MRGVVVELRGDGVDPRKLHVDFDDRDTIVSDKGDQYAFKNGIAVEGYQKSNLKGAGLSDLHYGVLVKDITPEYQSLELRVLDVKHEKPKSAEFPLPTLAAGKQPINSLVGFESQTFPSHGWELSVLSDNACRADEAAALKGVRGLLCQDLQSLQGTLIRAGLCFRLPVDRLPVQSMSWRLRANIKPVELEMDEGLVIHPLAFLTGDDVVAAACLRKIGNDKLVAGVLICSADGLFKERINVKKEGELILYTPARWELDLYRLGTRQTTVVLRLAGSEVARINGDTTSVEPDTGFVGILHRHSVLPITLHVDQLHLTEAPR